MNNEDWDDFRYFLAAAETGTFSAAAKRLHSNQPTVRRHVGALEQRLGTVLFKRRPQGLTLTDEGVAILNQCQMMQISTVKIHRTLSGQGNPYKGTVRLAIPEGICSELLLPQLCRFYERYPQIKLVLQVSSQAVNLTRGEADIAVRLFRPNSGGLVIRKLTDMSMSLYASKDYLRTHGQLAGESDFHQHRFIAYGDGLHHLPENQWLVDKTSAQNVVLQTDSTLCRLKATQEGVGLSLQPDLLVHDNDAMVRVMTEEKIPQHEVWLAYHDDLRHLDRIHAVVDFVVEIVNQP